MKELLLVSKEDLEEVIIKTLKSAFTKENEPKVEGRCNFIDSTTVSKRTGCHIQTIRNWAESGKLKGYKIDRKLLFDEREVEEFIRQKEIKPRQFPES